MEPLTFCAAFACYSIAMTLFMGYMLAESKIADDLYISENTVRNHVRNILDKLGMKSRFEAVNWAYREGLINIR